MPLLDQISDLRDAVITVDALHCQREHVTYLAERGAHWILTAKGNQPHLHAQLTALPWRAVPAGTFCHMRPILSPRIHVPTDARSRRSTHDWFHARHRLCR
ncbi:hypothetical protein [Micromonospora sp. NPDC003241]